MNVPIRSYLSKSVDLQILTVQNNTSFEHIVSAKVIKSIGRLDSESYNELIIKPGDTELLLLSLKNYQNIQTLERSEFEVALKVASRN